VYLGAKRRYINTLPFLSFPFVKVLRPTRRKIGRFGDVPQANRLAWNGKNKT